MVKALRFVKSMGGSLELLMPKRSIAGSVRISEVARLLADKGYTFEPRKRSHFSDQQRMDDIQNALEKLKKAEKRKN